MHSFTQTWSEIVMFDFCQSVVALTRGWPLVSLWSLNSFVYNTFRPRHVSPTSISHPPLLLAPGWDGAWGHLEPFISFSLYVCSTFLNKNNSPRILWYPGLVEGELWQAAGVVGPWCGFGRHPCFGPFPPIEGLLDANTEVGALVAGFDGGGPWWQRCRGPALVLHHVLQLVELDALVLQLLAQISQSSALFCQLLIEMFDLLLSGTKLLILPLALSLQLVHSGPQVVHWRVFEPMIFVASAVGRRSSAVRVFVTLWFHRTIPHLVIKTNKRDQSQY